MKKTNLEQINEKVELGKKIQNAVIEYNFDELPLDENIEKENFFGVKARINNSLPKNTCNLTYTM